MQDEGMKAHAVSQSLKSGGQPGLQRESLSYQKQNQKSVAGYSGTPLLPELRR